MICYVICSGPRAGSHYLANLLASTGVAGRPADHFNPWGARESVVPQDGRPIRYDQSYVDGLIAETSTPNGVFGTMIQFNQAANHVGLARLQTIFPSTPKFLFLTRDDHTKQAVSLAIARQTGQFLATQTPQRAPVYNADQIRCCLEDVRNHDRGWNTYFWEHQLMPHRIRLEECVADPVYTIDSALRFISGAELASAARPAHSSIRRQGTELNEQWTERYLQSAQQ